VLVIEAEARAIIEEASTTRRHCSADNLARFLGVTYEQRRRLGLTTIGSINVSKRDRRNLRRWQDRRYQERRRRAMGMRPQSQSLSATKPWEAMNMSRRTWERRRNKARDATLSATLFISLDDKTASPERKLGHPSGRLRRRGRKRKEQDMGRELSSQTATTMVAERFEALALELRFMALGLPIPGRFGADKQAA
jgi:hypothetical protein